MYLTKEYLKNNMNISEKVYDFSINTEKEIVGSFDKIHNIMEYNQYKVLKAMQDCKVSDIHFHWNSGYGYNDLGREAIEKVYSRVFKTGDAIVRPTIVSGTHALTLCLSGLLRPGDELVSVTGKPYDTLDEVIGIIDKNNGSLKEFGVIYKQLDLTEKGEINFDSLPSLISNKTKVVYIQRSTGYDWRKAVTIAEIKHVVEIVKSICCDIICMVDNCYGEFLERIEPTEVGVDVMAGSLIKNPGGGLVLSGGYIVGKEELINLISYRMTSQGIGKECGLTFGQTRNMFQGLFLAPSIVSGALKAAIFCAKAFESLGFEVCPKADDARSDIIQSIKLGSFEAVVLFCEAIQATAPVDSFVKPVPWNMPGYNCPVIMAAGAFVQGSSIELSADAPIREPYIVYFQGGLTYQHGKLGVLKALQLLYDNKLIRL